MAGRLAEHADAVVVPTRAVEDALRPHVRLPQVEVIGEGVSRRLQTLPVDAADRAAALGLPATGYLLSLATLEPRKGLDVLLQGLADPAAPDLPLVVVGQPGWGDTDPARCAADLGLAAGRVRVLGRIPDEDLAVVLHGASAIAVPSRAEGYGLPVLEGMAAGVPVVTSDAPALVEVGGSATRTAPIGDAAALARVLSEVVTDAPLRDRMIHAGLERAATATWAATASALVGLYEQLV